MAVVPVAQERPPLALVGTADTPEAAVAAAVLVTQSTPALVATVAMVIAG